LAAKPHHRLSELHRLGQAGADPGTLRYRANAAALIAVALGFGGYLAERSDFRPLEPGSPIVLGEVVLTPLAVDHGPIRPVCPVVGDFWIEPRICFVSRQAGR
jgi:hypothetical protein